MIQLDKKTVGLWFMPILNGGGDVFGALMESGEDFHLKFRSRVYDPTEPDNEAFSGKDVKNWMSLTLKKEKKRELIVKVDLFFLTLGNECGRCGDIKKLIQDERGFNNFVERFREWDCIHQRIEKVTIH